MCVCVVHQSTEILNVCFDLTSSGSAMEKPREFVEDWMIIQTLGEGAYGDVKLLVHKVTNQAIALKIVDLACHKDARECVRKEERLHRIVDHPHIIKLFGKREDGNKVYLFLEYASGGELFNRIEPDFGMPLAEAQRYMKQLLSGLSYLHTKGIAHRDIKPENLLLDDQGNLKISDFGMATVFRLKGKVRMLDKKCGTLPYVAPEVLEGLYRAEPADIWSSGIVLVTMLTGELPWDEPSEKFTEYLQWKKECCITSTPWSKMDNTALSLIRKILTPVVLNRPTIEQILQHPWMNATFEYSAKKDEADTPDGRIKKRQSSLTENHSSFDLPTVALSQPSPHTSKPAPEQIAQLIQPTKRVPCFSQPTYNEDLLVSSQIQFTQSPVTHNNFQCLIKRMTRFFVTTPFEQTVTCLCATLDKLHYNYNTDHTGIVTIATVDSRKTDLIFKANILEMDGKILLDFRLSKGCGLEFKKRFLKIKGCLGDIISSNSS